VLSGIEKDLLATAADVDFGCAVEGEGFGDHQSDACAVMRVAARLIEGCVLEACLAGSPVPLPVTNATRPSTRRCPADNSPSLAEGGVPALCSLPLPSADVAFASILRGLLKMEPLRK
jgi:hypothetical protein